MIGLSKTPKPDEILGPKKLETVELYAVWLAAST
jgi:hypothetical protein